MQYVSLYAIIPTPGFDLTTQNSYLTILFDCFTHHIIKCSPPGSQRGAEIKEMTWGCFFTLREGAKTHGGFTY